MLKSDLEEIISRLGNRINTFSGKTVVLTGGKGFLGRYFVDFFELLNTEILEKPLRLVGLDNLITAGDDASTLLETKHTEFIVHDVIKPFNFNFSRFFAYYRRRADFDYNFFKFINHYYLNIA